MIHVAAYGDGNPYHLSYIFAGLYDLAKRQQIKLDVTYPWSYSKNRPSPGDITLWLIVEDSLTNRSRKVVFDLHDKSDKYIIPRLEECDIYFKRSYYEPDVEKLSPNLRKKVVPFGLNYACRSAYETTPIFRMLGYYFAHRFNIRKPAVSAKYLYYSLYLLKQVYSSPRAVNFECTPDEELKPFIFFQTHVWGQYESDDNWIELNEGRVSVVRALKEAFGDQFIGGLIPTEVAVKYYPDCLTSLQTDRRSFIEMGKRSLIRIYTRGICHSIAWKLPEYLAASTCIVSEPLRNQMPAPLEPGKHYLEYHSPEECVAACQRLLNDPKLVFEMRQNNHAYYQEEVKPSVHILKCLKHALDFA